MPGALDCVSRGFVHFYPTLPGEFIVLLHTGSFQPKSQVWYKNIYFQKNNHES